MKRYFMVTDSLTNVISARIKLYDASIISGADFDVEDVELGAMHDSYFVCIRGTNKEISYFICYLILKGLKVEEFWTDF